MISEINDLEILAEYKNQQQKYAIVKECWGIMIMVDNGIHFADVVWYKIKTNDNENLPCKTSRVLFGIWLMEKRNAIPKQKSKWGL